MKKLAIAATILAGGLAASAATAQTQWSGNGHYYEFVQTNLTWADARADALSRSFNGQQGYLATVTSGDENTFLASLANGSLGWLGGSDETTEGSWIWVDGPEAGEAFTFTSWNGGEPNNCCSGEDYVHINWGNFGAWNDHNGGFTNGYLVEYGGLGGAIPEPSAWALLILGFGAVGGALRRSRKVRTALTYA